MEANHADVWAETWTRTAGETQALSIFERNIVSKILSRRRKKLEKKKNKHGDNCIYY
jgi:hypothetical protein